MKVEALTKSKKTGKTEKNVVDTTKLSKKQRGCVEVIEQSGIRQWSHANNGACFVWAAGAPYDGKVGWITYYLRDAEALRALTRSLGLLVHNLSGGRLIVQVVEKIDPSVQPPTAPENKS